MPKNAAIADIGRKKFILSVCLAEKFRRAFFIKPAQGLTEIVLFPRDERVKSKFYFKFTKNRLKQFTNSYNMSIIFPHERSISAFWRLCGFFGVNQERKRLIDRIRQGQGI